MNVLSLFDGMSCGRIALERAAVPVANYYASEIDKHAITVSQANYPNIVRLGSVVDVCAEELPPIDLLIGGSPCQGFSFAGKQLNFDDPRSKLFFEFVRLRRECKPKYFLLENVKMKKEHQDVISNALGVQPILINSALVSAQNRERLYWTNIPDVGQPTDLGVTANQYLGSPVDLSKKLQHPITPSIGTGIIDRRGFHSGNSNSQRVYGLRGKLPTLYTNNTGGNNPVWITQDDVTAHGASVGLCEFLQTVPDGYTSSASDNQAKRMLGNGWTVDVITHILRCVPNVELTRLAVGQSGGAKRNES